MQEHDYFSNFIIFLTSFKVHHLQSANNLTFLIKIKSIVGICAIFDCIYTGGLLAILTISSTISQSLDY